MAMQDIVHDRHCPMCGSLIIEDIIFTQSYCADYNSNLIVCKHCGSELEIVLRTVIISRNNI